MNNFCLYSLNNFDPHISKYFILNQKYTQNINWFLSKYETIIN